MKSDNPDGRDQNSTHHPRHGRHQVQTRTEALAGKAEHRAETTLNHGWDGLSLGYTTAAEDLDEIATEVEALGEHLDHGVAALDQIHDDTALSEVAIHLATADSHLAPATTALDAILRQPRHHQNHPRSNRGRLDPPKEILIEIRNDVPAPDYPLTAYRAETGAALQRLANAGLITFQQGSWGESDNSTAISTAQVRNRLDDGSAWDPDLAGPIIVEATTAGRDLAMTS